MPFYHSWSVPILKGTRFFRPNDYISDKTRRFEVLRPLHPCYKPFLCWSYGFLLAAAGLINMSYAATIGIIVTIFVLKDVVICM